MRLDTDRVAPLCRERGTSLSEGLRAGGISRNAYYTLARMQSGSLCATFSIDYRSKTEHSIAS